MNFFEAVQNRRTYYAIGKESPLSEDQLAELLSHAIKYTPSSFDSRSSRVVLLLDKGHQKLWEMVLEALRPKVPADQFAQTEEKIASFAEGCGTLLFYEDQTVVKELQEQYPLYQENFPVWSEQSSGMLQFVVWTGLEAKGLGASLQHYNPLIDREAALAFDIPEGWKLIAQMPFGIPMGRPDPRESVDLDGRLRVFKA